MPVIAELLCKMAEIGLCKHATRFITNGIFFGDFVQKCNQFERNWISGTPKIRSFATAVEVLERQ